MAPHRLNGPHSGHGRVLWIAPWVEGAGLELGRRGGRVDRQNGTHEGAAHGRNPTQGTHRPTQPKQRDLIGVREKVQRVAIKQQQKVFREVVMPQQRVGKSMVLQRMMAHSMRLFVA